MELAHDRRDCFAPGREIDLDLFLVDGRPPPTDGSSTGRRSATCGKPSQPGGGQAGADHQPAKKVETARLPPAEILAT
jgi:hypothetical protein